MDILEAILGFSMGTVFAGFFCVLFNFKFKSYCKLFLANTLSFSVYILLVQLNLLTYYSFTCFIFGVFGFAGFILPLISLFVKLY